MDHDERIAWAQFRFSVIAPLVCRKIDSEEQRRALVNEILEQVYVTPDGHQKRIAKRTLQEWVSQHKKLGFEGLLDSRRSTRGSCRAIPIETLDRAEFLRRQEPTRSIKTILSILKAEGYEARCIQHEIDHLNGILFIDHIVGDQFYNEHTGKSADLLHVLQLSKPNER